MSRRIKIGKLADGNYGLRISKSTFDADANPPVPANLIFDSQWPQLLPIHQSGSGTISGNNTVNISFPKLGYIPLFSYMLNPAGGSGWEINGSYNSQPYTGGVQAPASYLQVWCQDGTFGITDYPSTNSWPSSFTYAYVIYKVAG